VLIAPCVAIGVRGRPVRISRPGGVALGVIGFHLGDPGVDLADPGPKLAADAEAAWAAALAAQVVEGSGP